MHIYNAPLQDMRFLLTDVFDAPSFWQANDRLSHIDMDTVDSVLEALSTFTKKALLPLNRRGDEEGVGFSHDEMGYGAVSTPTGFKEAYAQYKADGWVGLGAAPEYGGQGFPKMVSMFQEEMMFSSNQAFALYPNLALGAGLCLLKSASEEQKQRYLEKIYTGEWAGTMCLTEAHAGTDLGLIKTKAVPNEDGSYDITGSKIFVTGGDHDLTENIIHLVLAKTPNAPAGSKGISLFIVPKYLLEKDAHDKRIVTAQLQDRSLDAPTCFFTDALSHFGGACKGDDTRDRMGVELVTDFRGFGYDDGQHTCGQSCFFKYFGQ